MPPCRARPAFYASHRVRPARRLLLRKEQGGHSSSRRHDERARSRLKRLVPRLAAALISRRCRARRRARRAARPRRSRRSRRSRMQGELLCRSRDRSTCAARRARCSPTRISRDIAAARQPGYAYECLHLRRAGKRCPALELGWLLASAAARALPRCRRRSRRRRCRLCAHCFPTSRRSASSSSSSGNSGALVGAT